MLGGLTDAHWLVSEWYEPGLTGGRVLSGHNSVSLGARDQTLGPVHRKEIPELSHQPYDMRLLK